MLSYWTTKQVVQMNTIALKGVADCEKATFMIEEICLKVQSDCSNSDNF